jgi:RsiW-degrading membrane proteinase PrsW (M82 family)
MSPLPLPVGRWGRLRRSLLGRALLLVGILLLAGFVLDALWLRHGSLRERAERLSSRGELEAAERLYARILATGPVDLPLLVELLDNHAPLVAGSLARKAGRGIVGFERPVLSPAEIERAISDPRLTADERLLARFWRDRASSLEDGADPAPILPLADRNPPAPLANHLLGRAALEEGEVDAAILRFEREGLAFPERSDDLRRVLHLLSAGNRWKEVERRIFDPAWKGAVDPFLRFDLAVEKRDWGGAIRWLLPASYFRTEGGPLLLALVAALAGLAFCGALGRVGDRPRFRIPLYAVAFLLGIASTWPTLFAAAVSDSFGFRETGEPVRDFLFYVFGVGLREELLKLAAFALLLPILLRRGIRQRAEPNRLEILAAAAFVGFGFAAEENLAYFSRGDLATALSRFLTANVLHLALTALLGAALADLVRDPSNRSDDFTRTLLLALGLHGAYDFFLASPAVAEWSFLAMTIFVWLVRRFLHELLAVRPRGGRPLAEVFVFSLAAIVGSSWIWAVTQVGPTAAVVALGEGLLGAAVLVYLFVRELRGE